jgi:hypothetical protein
VRVSAAWSLGVAVLLAGCGPPPPASPPQPDAVYDFAAEGEFPPVPAIPGDTLPGEDPAAGLQPPAPVVPAGADANRIQILATRDRQAAVDAARQVQERFGAVASVEYVESFHKVQVPCASAAECSTLCDRLRRSGFPSAWIVRPVSPR